MACLSIKDLGEVRKFLGMRVSLEDEKTCTVDQQATIKEMLETHGLKEASGVRAPISEESNEVEKDPVLLTNVPRQRGEPTIRDFQSLVGSLLWNARCLRPDISFAVRKATRRTHQPTMSDWKLTKRVARYLKETKNLKLKMIVSRNEEKNINLASWSDSDYAADKVDRKSVTGGVLTMDDAIV
uniref:Reverse transcriptase n=1 Tax=Peronospora matthiolae TaxID=2874970 RepID=A0AAV1UFG5_9STRA